MVESGLNVCMVNTIPKKNSFPYVKCFVGMVTELTEPIGNEKSDISQAIPFMNRIYKTHILRPL